MSNVSQMAIDAAISSIKEAEKINQEVQSLFKQGSPPWHKCESIDDRLHECLVKLGD
jgi:hypothetical protein